jgi:hypothetical protein
MQSNQIININQNNDLKKNIIKDGKKILNENNFFNELDSIMSDNKFRSFYDEYFKDFSDIKVVLMYMKLYETIQKEYIERYGIEIEKELLVVMMKELMSEHSTRKTIIDSFNNFTELNGKRQTILDIFENKNKYKSIKK